MLTLRVGAGPSVPLRFLEADGKRYVLPSSGPARWSSGALAIGSAQLVLADGRTETVAVRLVTDGEVAERIRSGFRARMGEAAWRHHFLDPPKVIELVPGPPPDRPPTEEELAHAEFEAIAANYLATLSSKPFERYLKERARTLLLERFSRCERLLEIGPGPGFETIPMLEAGHRVVAVDLSGQMLSELESRARAAGVSERLVTRVGRLSGLDEALRDLHGAAFDGAYSTFGAFNLEPDLAGVPRPLARHLRPGGQLVLIMLNRPGGVPMAYELLAGRVGAGFARTGDTVPAEAIRYPLRIHLPTSAHLASLLRPWFRSLGTEALSVLGPPFESRRLANFLGPTGRARARRLDETLRRLPGARALGEWIVLGFERTTIAPPP